MNYVTLFISSSLEIRRHHCVEGKQGHLEPWLKSSSAAQFQVCVLLLFFSSFQTLRFPEPSYCWQLDELPTTYDLLRYWIFKLKPNICENIRLPSWLWKMVSMIHHLCQYFTSREVEMHQQKQKNTPLQTDTCPPVKLA